MLAEERQVTGDMETWEIGSHKVIIQNVVIHKLYNNRSTRWKLQSFIHLEIFQHYHDGQHRT